MQETSGQADDSPRSFAAPGCAELNELLPSFRFRELIACGGMGAVYLAKQVSLSRDVAIKILPPALSAVEEFAQGFKVEARAMARLIHPNLIAIYDFGEIAGMLYIVMEYVDGNALNRSIKGNRIQPVQAAEIVEGVADGLGEAHRHGLVHRDIKPANILIDRKLKPVLGDFGLAVRADNVSAGMNMGTPGYVAPEVLRSFESASPASDIYSLGVILHELVTGVAPDPDEPVDLSLVPDTRGLPELVGRALAPEPADRPADGRAFADELATWLEAARKTNTPLLTAPSSSITTLPGTRPSAASPVRRGITAPLLAGVAILIVAAVVYALSRGNGPGDPSPGASGGPGTGNPPSPFHGTSPSSNTPSFDLQAHKSEMRNALIRARNDLVSARQRNVVQFQREVIGRERDWQPYLALIDHGRGILPRFLPARADLALDTTMVDLLNRYAIDHQKQLEYRHANVVKKLQQQAVDTLRSANALPGSRLFESETHWIEWLGASPFDILARPPDGEWVLRFGPEGSLPIRLIFDSPPKAEVIEGNYREKGELSITGDGELRIVREGDSGSFTLRWREPWLEGRDQDGRKVRFQRRNFQFAVRAARQSSSRRSLPEKAETPATLSPAPPENQPRDPQLARLQKQYRQNIEIRLGSWFRSYDRRIGELLEKFEADQSSTAVELLKQERSRIAELQWTKGYLGPLAIMSRNFVPPELRSARSRLEAHVASTLVELQDTYRIHLLKLRRLRRTAGSHTREIDEEVAPFLIRRMIDLSDFYNADPGSGTWSGHSAALIKPAFEAIRSKEGIRYTAGGILQLNSGIFDRSAGSRMRGKDLNTYYGRKWPRRVNDIPVYQKAEEIYMVGGVLWGVEEPGTEMARVTITYLDGSEAKPVPLIFLHNTGDWWTSRRIPGAALVWSGRRRETGGQPGLYETKLANPHPERPIKSLTIESRERMGGPFVLAISLDGASATAQ